MKFNRKLLILALFILTSCGNSIDMPDFDDKDIPKDRKIEKKAIKESHSLPFPAISSNPSPGPKVKSVFLEDANPMPLTPEMSQYLASEYEMNASKFSKASLTEFSLYFTDKAGKVRMNQETRPRLIDVELTATEEGFLTSNSYRKMSELFKKYPKMLQAKPEVIAKLLATYECAVFEIEKAVSSKGDIILDQCYTSLQAILKVVEGEAPNYGAREKLSDSKYIESVNKVFTVVEFENDSASVDIFSLERFKEVARILRNYRDYKIVLVGHKLNNVKPAQDLPPPQAAQLKNLMHQDEITKKRVLSVLKVLVMEGLNKDKIEISHPAPDKVSFLFNIKGETKNLVIIDIKATE